MIIPFRKVTLKYLAFTLTFVAVIETPRFSSAQKLAEPNSAPAASISPAPALQRHFPRYIIQRQDVLLVSFPLSPELNQTVTVQPDGYVSLRNADSVHVQGLTVSETVRVLVQAYAGILKDPIIDVDLEDFQKPQFTVSGQVGKPGQYELRSNLTVSEAIAVAGGLQPTAKTQVFLFHRASSGWYKVEEFNLKSLMSGKIKEEAEVSPGDMIIVPENAITKFRKYVPYSVTAGAYFQPFPN